MESDDKFPGAWRFCVVCVAGLSCERPHCPDSARDRPLDLSLKSIDFKMPSVLKRPTSLPIPKYLSPRTLSILDRDMSGPSKRASTPIPEFSFLAGFGNPHPYGRVLAMGQMRREKQKVAEKWEKQKVAERSVIL